MKLRSLSLDQFRKFDRPMRIDGLADGINVLCAPNEFGKSTLLAAIRAVLFERHSSRTASIRSYQPRLGGAAPTVSLSFEHGGVPHRIEKRFLLRPQATLLLNGATFEAEAAEEKLAAVLGVTAASRGSRDAARQAASIWEALLVDQGESFSQATLGDGARATLSDCLQAELGAVSGGVAIERLLKPVLAQLAERLDGHGRPRDRYKAAIADAEAAKTGIAALGERRSALLDDLTALHAARRALAQNSDPAQDEAARAELAGARRHRDALLGQRDRIGQATAAAELARASVDAIRAERARRLALAGQRDNNARALQRLRDGEFEARRRLAEAAAALEAARAAGSAAQHHADRAERALRLARVRRDGADRRARHARLRDRLADADAQIARIAALSARLEALRPDEAGILSLRQASLDDRADRAAVLAQATLVSLSLEVPAVLDRPGVAPVALPPGGRTLEITGPARLAIGGVGTIDIAPAAGDRDRLLAAAQRSARRLRALLDENGCADLDQAERRSADRAQLAPALEEAKRALAVAIGPEGLDSLRRQEAAARPERDEDMPAGTGDGPETDRADGPDHAAASSDANGAMQSAANTGAAGGTGRAGESIRPDPSSDRGDDEPGDDGDLPAGNDVSRSPPPVATEAIAAAPDASPEAALDAAQRDADQAQAAERAARDALHGPEAARDAARAVLAEIELGVGTADNERIRLQAALDQALAGEPDAALDSRLDAAERVLSDAGLALSALIAAAPDGTVALADARIARLEQAAANRADAQGSERERIARLEARIAAEEGAGLDEQIESAARRGEEAGRLIADNAREVAVLTLLRDTLLAADRAARERFLAPLVGRISPTLRALFPGASIALDDRFSIAGLSRRTGPDGSMPEPEAFDTLSHGTREQVAILARLAFADMLAAGGRPSFLVLDDALAFADADRMDRMFDILNEAGQRLQILVLTCREEVAARLGGRAVRLEPAGQG